MNMYLNLIKIIIQIEKSCREIWRTEKEVLSLRAILTCM
jgi:hypothetical protein